MISWILLGGAFFSLVLVIYWLTEKPKKPRSEYQLPPRRVCAGCGERFTTNLGGVCTTCLMERS